VLLGQIFSNSGDPYVNFATVSSTLLVTVTNTEISLVHFKLDDQGNFSFEQESLSEIPPIGFDRVRASSTKYLALTVGKKLLLTKALHGHALKEFSF
jgi:hypothetical protein